MKKLLSRLAVGALFASCLISARAEYPEKPVTLLVPFTAGGTSDIVARLLGDYLAKVWKQPVLVVNKPGAGGTIAMTQLAKSDPDGYTLVLTSSGNVVINPHLYKKPPYDSNKDIINITVLADLPFILVVDSKSNYNTLSKFLAQARANPRGLSMGVSGIGSHQFLAAQQFMAAAKVDINLIPYKGTPQQQTDLFGGSLDSMMDNIATELPMIRAGKVKPLAISSTKRVPHLPNLPTFIESGLPTFKSTPWYGVAAPKNLKPEVLAKIYGDVDKFLKAPETRKKMEELGFVIIGSNPDETRRRVEIESKEFADIINQLGLELQ